MITITLSRRESQTCITIIQNTWDGRTTLSRCLATLEFPVPEHLTARSAVVLALVDTLAWLGTDEAATSFRDGAAASPLGS